MEKRFVGVDLTSAFVSSGRPRPVDIAILEGIHVELTAWNWPIPEIVEEAGQDLATSFSQVVEWEPERTVVCIDGPQALSSRSDKPRWAEEQLSTPGRTPCELPESDSRRPFAGYIRSSILLFRALLKQEDLSYRLVGRDQDTIATSNLFEVFPGAEWSVLLGRQAPKKTSQDGRSVRAAIWRALGLEIWKQPELLSADQNDAIVAALLAKWTRDQTDSVTLVGAEPFGTPLREGLILHASAQLKHIDPPEDTMGGPEDEEEADWARDTLLLSFTDNGAVHGMEPENRWLVPGHSYNLTTMPPHQLCQFRLEYSPSIPGKRSWKCSPTVQQLLRKHLNLNPPGDLSSDRPVRVAVNSVQSQLDLAPDQLTF